MPPYGAKRKKAFEDSKSAMLVRLGKAMDIGPSILDGLHEATTKK